MVANFLSEINIRYLLLSVSSVYLFHLNHYEDIFTKKCNNTWKYSILAYECQVTNRVQYNLFSQGKYVPNNE